MRPQSISRRKFITRSTAALLSGWSINNHCLAAVPNWIDHRSHGPFHVQATFPLGSLTQLFHELSSLEHELQRTLAVPPAKQPINVYLLNDKQSHSQLLKQLFPQVPYRRALYVQRSGISNVYAYRHAELAVDLRHECTHALLHNNLAMVPLWLDEGLAEYFEMPTHLRSFGHPHLSKVRWNSRFGMIRNIESLESCSDLSDMGGVEYRFAWAWVHFMLHGPLVAHRALVHFLADIRKGNPPGQLSERLYQIVPNLDKQFAKHFKSWRK